LPLEEAHEELEQNQTGRLDHHHHALDDHHGEVAEDHHRGADHRVVHGIGNAYDGAETGYEVNKDLIPKPGTACKLILTLWDKPAEAAKSVLDYGGPLAAETRSEREQLARELQTSEAPKVDPAQQAKRAAAEYLDRFAAALVKQYIPIHPACRPVV
jgi:hypothetical protein